MPDERVRCVECSRDKGVVLLAAETHDETPPFATIILHCTSCDQHFRLAMMAGEDHVAMGWESIPCPNDPCPYAKAHQASHES